MAFFFSLLFIVTAYVTPEVIWGPLARISHGDHPGVAGDLAASLPNHRPVERSLNCRKRMRALRLPSRCRCPSRLEGGSAGLWHGLLRLPANRVFCFFLAAANFRTKRHFQLSRTGHVARRLVYFLVHGLLDLHNEVRPSRFHLWRRSELRRLRGLGFVLRSERLFAGNGQPDTAGLFVEEPKNRFLNVFLVWQSRCAVLVGRYVLHAFARCGTSP